MFFFVGQPH